MQIEFLRHGLPEGDKCLRGITDFPITEQGFVQMQQSFGLNSRDKEARPDLIISSPLKRCFTFASWLAQQEGIELVSDSIWQEMNFGIWDGLAMSDIFTKYPQESDIFWRDPFAYHIPQAETYSAFMQRIRDAWQALLDTHYAPQKRVLIVTHSGVMRQIVHHILQLPQASLTHLYQLNLPYAARMQVNISQDGDGQFWPQIQWPE